MEYITHLHKDKKLRTIISDASPLAPGKKKNLWLYLCASITSQQLSVKVAAVIWKRFLDLFEGKEPTPQEVLAAEPAQLRGIGLSNAKVKYVQAVAAFALEQGLEWKKLSKMENEAVINYVTTIKGVGRWTAEMMLMFALGREDVFAVDDLGIQNAMCRLYKLDAADKKQMKTDMLRISAKWTPYRTYACLHLWSWKDAK
ncbi:DNA-3-methyladenine glycosylase [Parasegetibacter sp. NRK P23]|uniref:DNA-3-methyladenine glycosylase family protein n=1 Tax=Parasegetibacter sp. NRK P23 TaxID=2942999 RepID=UPI0020435609|nr:DNA-3-methyladenine glycosylase 2 family protein [Parasegetibacter sp. NRK P23]MCM5527783.1 DNA-3-methyladenine glycosylase 2 family protein [Parasegetibacter sp. NRK P23]